MNIFTSSNTNISVRLFTILSAVALLLSALPVGLMVAHAAPAPLFSDTNVTVNSANSYDSGAIDITGYVDLELNFDYEAETLDSGDTFTYGWRDVNGEHVIGSFNGKNEVGANKDTDETGSKSESFAPQAGVTNIELFAEVDSKVTVPPTNPTSDEVVLITLDLTAVEPELNPDVYICHATAADVNPYNSQTVDAKSIVNLPNGHNTHDDGGLDDSGDIIPSFDYNFGDGLTTYPGMNWDTLYSNGLTGEEIHNNGSCDGQPVVIDVCPDGFTGTFPDCIPPVIDVCPDGFTGTFPDCFPPVVDTCPDGFTGTFPDCVPPVQECPDGYTGTYPECVPPQDNNGGGGNDEPTQCVDGVKDWADSVHWSLQGKLKNGDDITDVNRIDPNAALGESDWTAGDSTGFFSLGFGGSIKVEFDNYVVDVEGADISIHEATNGSYPLEEAEVWVSQNGDDWFLTGIADNTATDRVTLLDFSSTGLAWIKFVKVVDVSDPSLHVPTADAFDVDAIDATKSVCDKPDLEPEPEPTGACEIEGHKYDQLGNPLENWMMGLLKVASDGENTNIYYLLQDETDIDGYYCLEWDNVQWDNLQGEDNIDGDYTTFSYRVFEVLQDGWENVSVEAGADYNNLAVVPDEEIENDGEVVSVQIGEDNGFIIADAAYHVDFYNQEIEPVDPEDECVTTNIDNCEEVEECDPQYEECEESEPEAEAESRSSSSGTRVGGRSSGGGTGLTAPTPTPLVAGASDSAPVLGEQVSVVPYGGANAGGGATSPATTDNSFALMTVMLAAFGLIAARSRRFNG